MARLIHTTICSVDGYISDASGGFDWAAPDREVHAFVNDLERGVGTYLYGRRLYETMAYWETAPTDDPESDVAHDYARVWQAADKVVYSRTLEEVSSRRTTLERDFDPAAVARLVASADRDVSVGGAGLAGEALVAGIVDELQLLVVPAVVGGGTRALPDGIRLDLELLDSRRFAGGTTYARYAVNR
ncbi:dihydrofolate reductase family protein [Terrabacter sp. MAHUQ-38]|uniref:dihydrofolate reductase family protein n=1 Tax=unclassified Terrabacter TaxID=2630222 RepID=UPI00165D8D0B|nr:dihydrofolate reductase family protein [Terrabacter sp. MAHUQ-38]MBC9820829.1 dihydrofolate reductase family protein [Terrabacter sp. MAHUQ-38]